MSDPILSTGVNNNQPTAEATVPDPFANLGRLRLSQDFAAAAAVKPVLTTIAVRKPNRHEFVRVRPGSEWQFPTGTFCDKTDREVYLVEPDLWADMPGEVSPTVLFLAVSRQSPVPFFWPCYLPGPDGRSNRWHESAIEAAKLAESQWVRVAADMGAGCYVPYVAAGGLADPAWPEQDLENLLRLAFRDRIISRSDHPVLRRLRGES